MWEIKVVLHNELSNENVKGYFPDTWYSSWLILVV